MAAVLGAALLFLGGCASFPIGNPQAAVTCPDCGAGPVELPLLPGGSPWPIVGVAVDGRPGYRFLVDTGAMATVIFQHGGTADLSLSPRSQITVGGGGSGRQPTAGVVPGVTIGLGPVLIRDMTVLVLPVEGLELFPSSSAVFIDGIIGNDLWSRFGLEVDSAGGLLRLHRLGSTELGPVARSAPLVMRDDHLFVPVVITPRAGQPPVSVELLLDSGDRGTLHLASDPTRALVAPVDAAVREMRGIQGRTRVAVGRVADVELAGHRFLNTPTSFSPSGAVSAESGPSRLGAGLLSGMRWAVDVKLSRFWLNPGGQDERRFVDGSFGLDVVAAGDRLVAVSVAHGGPAARADLQAGDVVVRLNGTAITGVEQHVLDTALQTEMTLGLCWLRDAVERCANFQRAGP